MTPDLHFLVSGKFKEEFENGRDCYRLNGETIRLPEIRRIGRWRSRWCETTREVFGVSGATGELTTDLHLAALAIKHQAELHSNDSDFARFPGLRWVNPLS